MIAEVGRGEQPKDIDEEKGDLTREQRTNNRSHKNHTVAEYYTYCTQIEGEGEVKILQTETPGQNGSFCTFVMIIKNMP